MFNYSHVNHDIVAFSRIMHFDRGQTRKNNQETKEKLPHYSMNADTFSQWPYCLRYVMLICAFVTIKNPIPKQMQCESQIKTKSKYLYLEVKYVIPVGSDHSHPVKKNLGNMR